MKDRILNIPLARIKKNIKFDPEVKNISKDGLMLVGKSTELFLHYLSLNSLQVARSSRGGSSKKGISLKTADIIGAVNQGADNLKFLQLDFPKSAIEQLKINEKKAKDEAKEIVSISTEQDVPEVHFPEKNAGQPGPNSIASFFVRSEAVTNNNSHV